ncbi:fungal specific transcription factor domain-containing protein [Aspergillus undulatus]|uniref:fungal specific transcription factor domain-containing protein n=1 Tax=Aspergillus undulatus TaxID=1810928 RepID=UPI003CCCF817
MTLLIIFSGSQYEWLLTWECTGLFERMTCILKYVSFATGCGEVYTYALEHLLTFQLGQTMMIEDDEIDTPFPEDIPELQVPGYTSTVVEGQIATVKLLQIEGRIIKTMYPSIAPSSCRRVIDINACKALVAALERWQTELPRKLQLYSSSTRGIIPLDIAFLQSAAKTCLTAASSSISLMRTLKRRRFLCPYSCTDPLYCSGALHVLLLGAKLEPPGSATSATLAAEIQVLHELAKGSETAALSLQHIKPAFRSFLQTTDNSSSSTSPRSLQADGYRSWKSWRQSTAEDLSGIGLTPTTLTLSETLPMTETSNDLVELETQVSPSLSKLHHNRLKLSVQGLHNPTISHNTIGKRRTVISPSSYFGADTRAADSLPEPPYWL